MVNRTSLPKKVRKRDGRIVDFDKEKILQAVLKAAEAARDSNWRVAEIAAEKTIRHLKVQHQSLSGASIEQLLNTIISVLEEEGHYTTASFFKTKLKRKEKLQKPTGWEKLVNFIFEVTKKDRLSNKELVEEVLELVTRSMKICFGEEDIPGVEDIQDLVEKALVDSGHFRTAKTYILYRQKRSQIREKKEEIGVRDDLKLSLHAIRVLEKRRFLDSDEKGNIVESPSQMFRRVACFVAQPDLNYETLFGGRVDREKTEEEFYQAMANLKFLPNGPTLRNAARSTGQLADCFVIPVEDSLESIFEAVKECALIFQKDGGVGVTFGHLRPKGDKVASTTNPAGGPVSFLRIFSAAIHELTSHALRQGGMMGILPVHHPDILDFITCKDDNVSLRNFNISIGLTDAFMEAVKTDKEYSLINPKDKSEVRKIRAQTVFELMTTHAWKNGDPGIIFLDRLEEGNPTSHIGRIEATNVCGEQPLLPYEACNLGSINLAKFVKEGKVDWEELAKIVALAVHFLDNVIDVNQFPLPQIEKATKGNRKIGLGVMGFADFLVKLMIPYNTKRARDLAEKLMGFIFKEAQKTSQKLGEERGSFPNFPGSVWDKKGFPHMRNAALTTVAPTGSLSIIANCNGGIEPFFALAYINRGQFSSEGESQLEMVVVNELFESIAWEQGFYSEEMIREIAARGSIQEINQIPRKVREIFVTAHDFSPSDHIRMQAAFQKHVDASISKTINFPSQATVEDVKNAYFLAYELGCKGLTIYRDLSRENQPMVVGN